MIKWSIISTKCLDRKPNFCSLRSNRYPMIITHRCLNHTSITTSITIVCIPIITCFCSFSDSISTHWCRWCDNSSDCTSYSSSTCSYTDLVSIVSRVNSIIKYSRSTGIDSNTTLRWNMLDRENTGISYSIVSTTTSPITRVWSGVVGVLWF